MSRRDNLYKLGGLVRLMIFADLRNSRSYRTIDETRDSRLRKLYEYWKDRCAGRIMPSRADIDPIDFPALLPNISLINIVPDRPIEERYTVRLFGTELVRMHESDWTGRSLFDCTSREAALRLCAAGEHVAHNKIPWQSTGELYWVPQKSYLDFEVLILPLSDDGQTVNMLLCLTLILIPG